MSLEPANDSRLAVLPALHKPRVSTKSSVADRKIAAVIQKIQRSKARTKLSTALRTLRPEPCIDPKTGICLERFLYRFQDKNLYRFQDRKDCTRGHASSLWITKFMNYAHAPMSSCRVLLHPCRLCMRSRRKREVSRQCFCAHVVSVCTHVENARSQDKTGFHNRCQTPTEKSAR